MLFFVDMGYYLLPTPVFTSDFVIIVDIKLYIFFEICGQKPSGVCRKTTRFSHRFCLKPSQTGQRFRVPQPSDSNSWRGRFLTSPRVEHLFHYKCD